MNVPNRLYRPRVRIEDVRRPSSYFQSPDVAATPFTQVGQLTDEGPAPPAVTPENIPTSSSNVAPIEIKNKRYPRPPIFPAHFLDRTSTSFGQSEPETMHTIPPPRLHRKVPGSLKRATTVTALSTMAALASRIWVKPWNALKATHPTWAHRRYIVDKGWRLGLADRTRRHKRTVAAFCIAGILALLLVFFRPGSLHQPANKSNTTAGSDTYSATGANVPTPTGTSQDSSARNHAPATTGNNAPNSSSQLSTTTSPGSSSASNSGTSTTAGRGSGPTSPGIPGVTTPQPVTVPGQSVSAGGKQVVGTNPIGITLN